MRIPTSCPTRCFRSPTATSSSPPATTASTQKLCGVLGAPELAKDPTYIDNKARLANRADIVGKLSALTGRCKSADLGDKLEAVGVPAGPINKLDQVFADPHVKHRGMKLDLPSAEAKAAPSRASARRSCSTAPRWRRRAPRRSSASTPRRS